MAGFTERATGARLSRDQAVAAFAPHAVEELLAVAGTYTATVAYSQLATRLSDRAGIDVRGLLNQWIGYVLGEVADQSATQGWPLLSALAVDRFGRVGGGYAVAVARREGSAPDDVDLHAATERLECYRTFGAATLPLNGGQAQLEPRVAKARLRAHRKVTHSEPAPLCSLCHERLPRTGICDNH